MPANYDNTRCRPCYLLHRCGIPSVVWFEDALKAYGVPTMLFELYILVPDINNAAHVLEQNGWKPIPQQLGKIGNANVDLTIHPQLCLAPSQEDCKENQPAHQPQALAPSVLIPPKNHTPPTIVLLPAAEWNFNFEKYAYSIAFLPSLEDLLDGLLDSLLDCYDQNLQDYLNVQLCYLYGYVPELQEKAFAKRLLYAHRQYHLDIMSGMNYGTLPFVAHQRKVRNALRKGLRELEECSSTRDNKDLFNHAVQAQLLATLPALRDEDTDESKEMDGDDNCLRVQEGKTSITILDGNSWSKSLGNNALST